MRQCLNTESNTFTSRGGPPLVILCRVYTAVQYRTTNTVRESLGYGGEKGVDAL